MRPGCVLLPQRLPVRHRHARRVPRVARRPGAGGRRHTSRRREREGSVGGAPVLGAVFTLVALTGAMIGAGIGMVQDRGARRDPPRALTRTARWGVFGLALLAAGGWRRTSLRGALRPTTPSVQP